MKESIKTTMEIQENRNGGIIMKDYCDSCGEGNVDLKWIESYKEWMCDQCIDLMLENADDFIALAKLILELMKTLPDDLIEVIKIKKEDIPKEQKLNQFNIYSEKNLLKYNKIKNLLDEQYGEEESCRTGEEE
jgi:hypothetical protein